MHHVQKTLKITIFNAGAPRWWWSSRRRVFKGAGGLPLEHPWRKVVLQR